jgi:hypothetical protein
MNKEKRNTLLLVFIIFMVVIVMCLDSFLLNTKISELKTENSLLKKESFDDYLYLLKENQNINDQTILNEIHNKVCPNCVCNTQLCEIDKFSQILLDNANNYPYILDVYDCEEFSENLNNDLNLKGFDSKLKGIRVDCDLWTDDWDSLEENSGISYDNCLINNRHQIVEINHLYIETTTGEIIMPHEYSAYNIK